MGLLDGFRTSRRLRQEQAELRDLYGRLSRHAILAEDTCQQLCWRVVLEKHLHSPRDLPKPLEEAGWRLCWELLVYEGYFPPVKIDWKRERLSLGRVFDLTKIIRHQLAFFEDSQTQQHIEEILTRLLDRLLEKRLIAQLHTAETETLPLFVPCVSLLTNPAAAIEAILPILAEMCSQTGHPFDRLGQTLWRNLCFISGIDPDHPEASRKRPLLATHATDKTPEELVHTYLADTPFIRFFNTSLPFSIPLSSRFEHMHVLGGSGHGKTQLLQSLQLSDIRQVMQGTASVIVIDSQGDMIRTILNLAALSPAQEESPAARVVLIDPNDIEHPPALNLFDFGLDRLTRYDPVEREKLINGAIALYEYVFGALLGAELTQRQGVIFRYLARLLMVVPNATIHTLMKFMDEPEATRLHLAKLDPVSQHFFESQFFSKKFDDTRQQILTRLWGVLSNSVLARMFSNPHNKLNLFDAMNRGSLILINTAKDLLKQDGCEIFGRFFIALIAQAAQERAAIDPNHRRATFVYIDEAQDYFDESMELLFNQARKYRVSLSVAHQNLNQFETKLQGAVMASTAIKFAGGVSARDAGVLAKEMRCEPEFLQEMRKGDKQTEFACFIRNVTVRPVRVAIPFGQMESQPRMGKSEYEELLARNRARYSAGGEDEPHAPSSHPQPDIPPDSPLEKPELL